jgi:hypothetical protein
MRIQNTEYLYTLLFSNYRRNFHCQLHSLKPRIRPGLILCRLGGGKCDLTLPAMGHIHKYVLSPFEFFAVPFGGVVQRHIRSKHLR